MVFFSFETLCDVFQSLGQASIDFYTSISTTDGFSMSIGNDLGRNFGSNLTECEVNWLVEREFATTAEDIIWRRSKLGLRMTSKEIDALDSWMANATAIVPKQHAV